MVSEGQKYACLEDAQHKPAHKKYRFNPNFTARFPWKFGLPFPEFAAVRLPGIEPLVLCEGIENALSIWQAVALHPEVTRVGV